MTNPATILLPLAFTTIGVGIALIAGTVQLELTQVLLVFAFGAIGLQMWSTRRDISLLKERVQDTSIGYHRLRDGYMTTLLACQILSHVVHEEAKDQATRYRIQEIQEEVKRQIAEIEAEKKREEVESRVKIR